MQNTQVYNEIKIKKKYKKRETKGREREREGGETSRRQGVCVIDKPRPLKKIYHTPMGYKRRIFTQISAKKAKGSKIYIITYNHDSKRKFDVRRKKPPPPEPGGLVGVADGLGELLAGVPLGVVHEPEKLENQDRGEPLGRTPGPTDGGWGMGGGRGWLLSKPITSSKHTHRKHNTEKKPPKKVKGAESLGWVVRGRLVCGLRVECPRCGYLPPHGALSHDKWNIKLTTSQGGGGGRQADGLVNDVKVSWTLRTAE